MFRTASIALLALSLIQYSSAATLHLTVPRMTESPQTSAYYLELLQQAVAAQGHSISLEILDIPQQRAVHWLEHNKIDLIWLISSQQRNGKYASIPINLTNGLIGKRVFFIRPEDQHRFSTIKTLTDLRNSQLTAAMGRSWFDAEVWQLNKLRFREDSGEWRDIFRILPYANRSPYDYFPRGANEIITEAQQHPKLAIERNLLLVYDRDFRFYFSERGQPHIKLLAKALKHAQQSGLLDKLMRKHWHSQLEQLKLEQRTTIYLQTPQ